MTVDSNARREAILFEISAVAIRYEQDSAPSDPRERRRDLKASLERVATDTPSAPRAALTELAGRCVAWLEHLEREDGT